MAKTAVDDQPSKPKHPGGRPLKEVDESLVEKLAMIHCTMSEIAATVGCSVDTLERRFADVIKNGKEKGKTSLRRFQYLAAEKGNVAMLIWLGKSILGQRENYDFPVDNHTQTQELNRILAELTAAGKLRLKSSNQKENESQAS